LRFNLIDKNEWERTPYFDYFIDDVRCTISMTANIDITSLLKNLKSKRLKIYPTLIYLTTRIVNSHEEFRTAFDDEGRLGIWDSLNPIFAIFHKENQTFSNIWTEYLSNFKLFYDGYIEKMQKFSAIKKIFPMGEKPKNLFCISCTPWISFTGLTINVYDEGKCLSPLVTFGKFFEENKKVLIPVTLQVHHAVCDGFHVSRFFNEFERMAQNFFEEGN
jgi:chloramphenicol O-acetyltransferase type A